VALAGFGGSTAVVPSSLLHAPADSRYALPTGYTVFRSAADAQASVAKPIANLAEPLHVIARSVPGFDSFTGHRFSGTVIGTNKTGQKITATSSEASIADGNLTVKVDTIDAPQDEIPVLRWAVTHLQSAGRLAAP